VLRLQTSKIPRKPRNHRFVIPAGSLLLIPTPFDAKDPNLMPFANAFKEVLDQLLNDDDLFQSILNWNARVKNSEVDHSLSKFDVERVVQFH
jgi:hypothetical protein